MSQKCCSTLLAGMGVAISTFMLGYAAFPQKKPEKEVSPITSDDSTPPPEKSIDIGNILRTILYAPITLIKGGVYYFVWGSVLIAIPAYLVNIVRRMNAAVRTLQYTVGPGNIALEINNLRRDLNIMRDGAINDLANFDKEILQKTTQTVEELQQLKQEMELRNVKIPQKIKTLKQNLEEARMNIKEDIRFSQLRTEQKLQEQAKNVQEAQNKLDEALEDQKEFIRKASDTINKALQDILDEVGKEEQEEKPMGGFFVINPEGMMYRMNTAGLENLEPTQAKKPVETIEIQNKIELLEEEQISDLLQQTDIDVQDTGQFNSLFELPATLAKKIVAKKTQERLGIPIVQENVQRPIIIEEKEEEVVENVNVSNAITQEIISAAVSEIRVILERLNNLNLNEDERDLLSTIYRNTQDYETNITLYEKDLEILKELVIKKTNRPTQIPNIVLPPEDVIFWNEMIRFMRNFDKSKELNPDAYKIKKLNAIISMINKFLERKNFKLSKTVLFKIDRRYTGIEVQDRRNIISNFWRLILLPIKPEDRLLKKKK